MGPLGTALEEGQRVVLNLEYRYLLNVGSIGQPRDRDPRAAFGIYDHEAGTVEFRRVDYDVATAQSKIQKAGLPAFLAERLSRGV